MKWIPLPKTQWRIKTFVGSDMWSLIIEYVLCSAMLGPIRAMFLEYSIDRYRTSDGTPKAATVAVTKGRV